MNVSVSFVTVGERDVNVSPSFTPLSQSLPIAKYYTVSL